MAALESERTIIHCMIVEDIDSSIHGVKEYPNFDTIVHMREVAFADSSDTTFDGYTWRERVVILRIILCYLEAMLANIQTTIRKAKASSSLGMNWHFVGIKVWLSWVAFFKSYIDAFFTIRIAFLSIAKAKIEDAFTVAIHVLGVALIVNDGVLILAYYDDDLEIVCYFTSNIKEVYLCTLSIQVAKGTMLV